MASEAVRSRRRPPGWAIALWAGVVLLLVLLATFTSGTGVVVVSALAGAATGLAAWTALDVGRAQKNQRVLRAKEEEFLEFAKAIEVRVEHAEAELGAAVDSARQDSVSAVRTLREEFNVLEQSMREALADHRRLHEPRHGRPIAATRLDAHVDEVIGAAAAGESASKSAPEAPDAGGLALSLIPGLDDSHLLRLHAAGIHDTEQLMAADPVNVAKRLRVWPNLVRDWQVSAQMLPKRTLEAGATS